MSTLWLDTELQDYDFDYVARIMIESGYSPEQLELIFTIEVAPICGWNMYSVAGVWDGFDNERLSEEIQKNIRRQEKNFFYRWYINSRIAKFLLALPIWTDWEKTIAIYKTKLENL
jgi:hypothetical protein